VIDSRLIKKLSFSRVRLVVILADLYIKIRYPAQLSIDVTVSGQFRIVWHSGAFGLIFVEGVHRALRAQHHFVTVFEVFTEVLLVI